MITLSQAITNRIKEMTRVIRCKAHGKSKGICNDCPSINQALFETEMIASDILVRPSRDGNSVRVELRTGKEGTKVTDELSTLGDISETVDGFASRVIRDYYKQKKQSK